MLTPAIRLYFGYEDTLSWDREEPQRRDVASFMTFWHEAASQVPFPYVLHQSQPGGNADITAEVARGGQGPSSGSGMQDHRDSSRSPNDLQGRKETDVMDYFSVI